MCIFNNLMIRFQTPGPQTECTSPFRAAIRSFRNMREPNAEIPTFHQSESGISDIGNCWARKFLHRFRRCRPSGLLKSESGMSEIPDYFRLSGAVVQHWVIKTTCPRSFRFLRIYGALLNIFDWKSVPSQLTFILCTCCPKNRRKRASWDTPECTLTRLVHHNSHHILAILAF